MFVIVGGLVVLLLSAALVAPLFVNWTDYREQFEAEATKILGRTVTVEGIASARLIPFPSVTFEGISVGSELIDPVLTAERFSMDAELAPFLSGEVLIFDMRLDRPKGRLTVHEDGTIDWALRPSTPFDPKQVKIENLVIENGQIDIVDEAFGTSHRLDIAKATVSARGLTGPWKVSTEVTADGEKLVVDGSTGQPDETGKLPVRLKVFPAGRALAIETDGSASATNGRIGYSGQFLLRPASLSDPASASMRRSDSESPAAFRVTGTFDFKPEWLTLPEIRLETGDPENPYVANGKGAISFAGTPRFNISLDGNQVEFSEKGDKIAAGSSLEARIKAFRTFVDTVPLPAMAGTITVNLPAVVAGDTTIREVSFQAEPATSGWRVEGFRATLPGRTKLEAGGLLGTGDGFGFKGNLIVASTQPSGLANWLGAALATPAVRLLTGAGFSANVDFAPGMQKFDALELAIGASVLTGSALRRTDGERPLVELALKGDALDLGTLSAFGGMLFNGGAGAPDLGHDLALTLDAGPVSASGLEADAFGLTARIKEDRADIDRLMVTNLAGASLSATGSVTDLSLTPSGTVDASIVSADGAELVSTLAAHFSGFDWLNATAGRISATPDLLSDLQLSLIASTAPEDKERSWTLSGNAKAASGSASFSGNWKAGTDGFANAAGEWQVTATQDEPLNFLSLAGIDLVPLGAPGPATLELKAKGRPGSAVDIEMSYSADGTSANFSGTRGNETNGPVLAGKMSLVSDDLDPYLLATGLAFPGTGLGTPVAIESGLARSERSIELKELVATVGDTKLEGELGFSTSGERLTVSGGLAVDRVDTGWLVEMIAGAAALQPVLEGQEPAPFANSASLPADGRIRLQAKAFDLAQAGTATDASAELAFDAGSIRVEKFEGGFADGKLTGSVAGVNQEGTVTIGGDFALSNAAIGKLMTSPGISAQADLSGTLSASGKTMDGLLASLAGSGVLSVSKGTIFNINADGLATFLAVPMTDGKAPDEASVQSLIGKSVFTGSMPFDKVTAAWTATSGKLRLPSVRVASGGAAVEAEAEADLAAQTISVNGRVIYDAGKQALAGAETVVPFTVSRNAFESVLTSDAQPMTQFLVQRALEAEQERVEAMQAALSDKQRLRRDVRIVQLAYAARDARAAARETAVRESARRLGEEARLRWDVRKAELEEEARLKKEAEEKAKAEEAAAKAAAAAAKAAETLANPDFTPDSTLPQTPAPLLPEIDLNLNP